MAYHDAHTASATDLPHRLLDGIKAVFSFIGMSLVAAAQANRRVKLVEQLSAKSDAELAEMGMRREDIVRHVFADVSHI